MSDLDQQLRELFHHKEAAVGPPPALREVPPTRWWSRPRRWLLVPVTALATAAVVIPIALVSQNAEVTVMPAHEAQAWAEDVCNERPSESLPAKDQVGAMTVVASAVCHWENPANLADTTVGLQSTTALSTDQITTMQDLIARSIRESPSCSMIDSPPQVEYYVFLGDADGQEWRINVPEPACLGFDLEGEHFSSPGLVDWLRDLSSDGFAEFRGDVLDCPDVQPLPGNRLPTCEVPLDRLLDYGQEACAWLQGQPVALEWTGGDDHWNDPYNVETIADTFAAETVKARSVPAALERPERALVASAAWRTLCPEFGDRYNTPPADAGD